MHIKPAEYIVRGFAFWVQPKMQLFLFVISLCVLSAVLYHNRQHSRSLEYFDLVKPITPAVIKEWGSIPTLVKTGMHIINFPEFSVLNQQFVCDAILWFDFDSSLVSLETIEKFSFERGNMLKISSPSTKVVGGRLFAQYTIRLQFTSDLNYSKFPFDDHRINLILTNIYLSPKEILFDSGNAAFSFSGDMREWYPVDTFVQKGYTEAFLDKQDTSKVVRHPAVVFSIDFRRIGMRHFLIIFLPLFAVFFTVLFTLSFDPATMGAVLVGSSSGAIGSMISYRFVTQSMSPQVGYFLFNDYIFTLFMLLEVLQFILVILLIINKKWSPQFSKSMCGAFVLFVHSVLITVWSYLLL